MIALISILAIVVFVFFGKIAAEYFFHPREIQRRKHKGIDFKKGKAKLPAESPDGNRKVELEVSVKYNEEKDLYFMKNGSPRVGGRRYQPDWIKVESDSIKERIKKQV